MQYKEVLIFIGGAGIGSLISWYYTKKKYDEIARSEIATMREVYRKKNKDLAEKARNKPEPEELVKKIEVEEREQARVQYDRIINNSEYRTGIDIPKSVNELENGDITYIDDEEYLSMNGYDKVNLVLYRDNILAGEVDDEIVLVEDSVGQETIDNLREYKPEAIYVRNDKTKTEYEVTTDDRTYGEVTGIRIKEYDD